MRESDRKGVANGPGPEPCVVGRKANTGAAVDPWALSGRPGGAGWPPRGKYRLTLSASSNKSASDSQFHAPHVESNRTASPTPGNAVLLRLILTRGTPWSIGRIRLRGV